MKNQKELSWNDIKKMNAEIAKMKKEHRKEIKEIRQIHKETKLILKETAVSMKETDKKFTRTEKMIANSNERIEGISKSNGEFCEEYFINSFKENPTLFGERFDRVLEYHRPLTAVIDDEYDLILRNGTSVALIEMKYKAGINDVGKMFSKLNSYRANYPMDKNYKIYLCLASFRFPEAIRARAADEGIVLIQQRGDKIEVISDNIKTW